MRIYDPRQLACVSHDDIGDYTIIKGLVNPSPELMDEWLIYSRIQLERFGCYLGTSHICRI